MWIMLIKKLPTVVSPPKMSIHWSVPWPMDVEKRKSKYWELWKVEIWGCEPDYLGARKIRYKGENIRVWPHEFSEIETPKLMGWINQEAFELISDSVAEEELIEEVLSKGKRKVYDAALVDGCTSAQAMMVAFGKDPTLEDPELPAIGWYKCAEQYARYFCYEDEMKG